MASSTLSVNHPFEGDHEVWDNLKQAITSCSGFKQWQKRQKTDSQSLPLDQQVRCYLRETLETLAY